MCGESYARGWQRLFILLGRIIAASKQPRELPRLAARAGRHFFRSGGLHPFRAASQRGDNHILPRHEGGEQ